MNATKSLIFAAVLGVFGYAGGTSHAAEGPFAHFTGNWSGSGVITVQNGSRERIRCRAHYVAREAGNGLGLLLRCASDSYKFELQSDISYDRGNITGSWNEASRQIYGQLAGQATANRIDAKASSVGFNAILSLTSRGNNQTVSMKSPGSEISEVTVALTRSSR
jgi:hypothetical protein